MWERACTEWRSIAPNRYSTTWGLEMEDARRNLNRGAKPVQQGPAVSSSTRRWSFPAKSVRNGFLALPQHPASLRSLVLPVPCRIRGKRSRGRSRRARRVSARVSARANCCSSFMLFGIAEMLPHELRRALVPLCRRQATITPRGRSRWPTRSESRADITMNAKTGTA